MLSIIARILILLDALIFIMVGTFIFTGAGDMVIFRDHDLSPAGLTGVRTWGGMFIGVSLSVIFLVARQSTAVQAGLVMFLIGSAVVLSRLYGIQVDGVEPKQFTELRDEALGPGLSGLALVLMWWQHKRRNA